MLKFKAVLPLLAAVPMLALLSGCEVNDNRADDQMPIWYPAFIYHGAAPDVNAAGVNGGGSDQNGQPNTTAPAGVDASSSG